MTTTTTAPPTSTVPIEDAPALTTGRRSVPRERRLGPEDYRRVLKTGVAVRLDLSAGLTQAALALAGVERDVGATVRKGISIARAGDLCVYSEGEVRIDPRVRDVLVRLRGDSPEPFYLLNELVDLFLATGAEPWSRMVSIADQLSTLGLPVRDVATAVDDDPATELNLLMLRGAGDAPATLLDQYGVDAPEIRSGGPMPERLGVLLDEGEDLIIEPLEEATEYASRRLGHTVRRRWRVRPAYARRCLITSDAAGWRVCDAGDERLVDTDELCRWLASPDAVGAAVVCEADDFAAPSAPTSSPIRHLPYPFEHYLAINSDVDFSTEAQIERTLEAVTDTLGLALGGSFYLDAARADAVAATSAPIERWAAQGAIDTLHAWLDTIDVEGDEVALDPDGTRAVAEDFAARGLAPLLFTTHGGGRAVKCYGNLHTRKVSGRLVEESRHDMDRLDSPFYLMPALRRLGVRFVSPIGSASTPKLTPIGELVETLDLADGSRIGAFRRLMSRRHVELGFPERWRPGKNAANPAALGFQVSDVLQRLSWTEPGHGGILYTHLGHNVGDQTIDRLGWSEETHRAFERLAREHHRGALWVVPASVALLYANSRQRAAEVVEVHGDVVSIGSWRDERLDLTAPAYETHGTTLLHGLTVYVDDAARARVEVQGRAIDAFVRNPPDATGRSSVTIVDDTAPRAVLLHGNAVRAGGNSWTVAPIPLRGVTHAAFAVGGPATIGLGDTRGVWQEVTVQDAGRHVIPLTLRGSLAGVRIDGASTALRDVVLLRPRACVREVGEKRVLGGRVSCDAPIDRGSWRVVAGDRRAEIDESGWYAFRDLPRNARVQCHLEADGRRLPSIRGCEALMTCDQWDWDYEVRIADLLR